MYLTQHLGNCPIRCDQFLGNYVSYTVSPGVSRVQCQWTKNANCKGITQAEPMPQGCAPMPAHCSTPATNPCPCCILRSLNTHKTNPAILGKIQGCFSRRKIKPNKTNIKEQIKPNKKLRAKNANIYIYMYIYIYIHIYIHTHTHYTLFIYI